MENYMFTGKLRVEYEWRRSCEISIGCSEYSTFKKIYEALEPIINEERELLEKKYEEGVN